MYTPICIENYIQPVRACKTVCERARLGCEKYMKQFGFEWPVHMNCDLFPEYGSLNEVCMDPIDAQPSSTQVQQKSRKQQHQQYQPSKFFDSNENNNKLFSIDITTPAIVYENDNNNDLNRLCTRPLVKINDYKDTRYNRISFGNVINCAQSCHDNYFSTNEHQFTYIWILFWSILCLLSTLFTALTYIIETNRFKYPEKPIIYLSICYLFVSIGFLTKYIVGHDQIACELDGSIRNIVVSSRNQTATSSLLCTIVFILIYYFSMASSVWWVVISLTWFLAAGLKWGIESISKYSYYYHMAAWILPGIKVVLILSIGLLDADPLTGICYIGNTHIKSLQLFIILPMFIYLTIGITFLLLGFISLFRLRNLIKQQHGDHVKTTKLEKLMLRIGIFSILYTIPATCLLSCYFYEQYYRIEWEQNYMCRQQQLAAAFDHNDASFMIDFAAINNYDCFSTRKPEFLIFMLKYFSILIIGVTSSIWIWTAKTYNSWKTFIMKSLCCCLFNFYFKNFKRNKKNSIIYFKAASNEEIENTNANSSNVNGLSQSGNEAQQQPRQVHVYQFRMNNNHNTNVDNNGDHMNDEQDIDYCNIALSNANSNQNNTNSGGSCINANSITNGSGVQIVTSSFTTSSTSSSSASAISSSLASKLNNGYPLFPNHYMQQQQQQQQQYPIHKYMQNQNATNGSYYDNAHTKQDVKLVIRYPNKYNNQAPSPTILRK